MAMSQYNYTPRKIIKLLAQNGFFFVRQNGSHALLKNFDQNKKVIVPIHSRTMPVGTARAILKDADLL